MTVGARIFEQQVDFGVLVTDGNRVISLEEKPTERYQVNAGIYVVDPSVLDFIGDRPRYVDMTEVIEHSLQSGKIVQTFAIHEYWKDIGRPDDLNQASKDYRNVFRD